MRATQWRPAAALKITRKRERRATTTMTMTTTTTMTRRRRRRRHSLIAKAKEKSSDENANSQQHVDDDNNEEKKKKTRRSGVKRKGLRTFFRFFASAFNVFRRLSRMFRGARSVAASFVFCCVLSVRMLSGTALGSSVLSKACGVYCSMHLPRGSRVEVEEIDVDALNLKKKAVDMRGLHLIHMGEKVLTCKRMSIDKRGKLQGTCAPNFAALETKVHPLLADILKMDGAMLDMEAARKGGAWEIRVLPMRLSLKPSSFVTSLLRVLRYNISSDRALVASTSKISITVDKEGTASYSRFSFQVGGEEGLEIIQTSGKVSRTGDLEMELEVPASALRRFVGKKHKSDVPDDLVIAIPVRGTAKQPHVDWVQLTQQIMMKLLQRTLA